VTAASDARTADVFAVPDARTARIVDALAAAFGGACAAILHYGSHAQRSDARPESAYDFFVIVDEYPPAYRSLAHTRGLARSPSFAARLNRILPPNVVAVVIPELAPPALAKCAVLSLADLGRAVSPRARDHFVQGRLFQHVQLAFARDASSRSAVLAALAECRERTLVWGRPYLPPAFDADGYIRALLERSFAAEVRPEGADRIDALTGAQRDALAPVYDELLQRFVARNVIRREGKVYRLALPVSPAERRRQERWFARSKRRATMRWAKYVLLYENWLTYVVEKIERRSGVAIELSERERRWPLIFLWPRVMRYLRTRPQRHPTR
jgi:hypothetical protein